MNKKLLIIDGNAIVHRAFHAYPPLTRNDGQIVNAVYGFLAMLIKVLEEVQPDYLVVTFDRPAPTFRKLLYAGYQANRPQMADGLSYQIELLHEALETIGIPIFEIDGYEADDIIGTIAHQVQMQDVEHIETVILSGDRDLLQLVNDKTKVFMPIVGITKFTLYDPEKVEEKFGITPSQIIDYKALIGDASDGYPGVSGIGPKTASSLLQKYESFENIYHHVSELSERIALKLATDAEQAALAKKLATIALDAPVHLNLSKCSLKLFTRDKVEKVCDMFDFVSIKKRLGVFPEPIKKENQLELL
jgi:DNA polymerase I